MKQMVRNRTVAFKECIVRVALDMLGDAPVGLLQRTLLRVLSRKALRPVSLPAAAAQSHLLRGPSRSTVALPCPVGEAPVVREGHFASLYGHVLKDVTVTPYASGAVTQDQLLLPECLLRDRGRVRTDGAGLFRLDSKHCVGGTKQPERIKEAIFMGGAGAFNWYHFLIECLPKAYLVQELPPGMETWPLLVPEECVRYPSFRAALALFACGRPIRPVARGTTVHVERLVMCDDASHGPFNLHKGHWPQTSDYRQHDDFLRDYLLRLRSGFAPVRQIMPPKRRIFLTRPGVRRNYNQDELSSIAERYGFERHAPETLSLADQASLFATAGMVVGASGAAWVGMSFCQGPAQFLSWLPKEYREFCSYSSLASLLGHRMEFLESTPDLPVETSDAAYLQSYRVEPEAFEAALKSMTQDA